MSCPLHQEAWKRALFAFAAVGDNNIGAWGRVGVVKNHARMWAHLGSRRPKRLLGGSPVIISASSTPKLRQA